MRTALTSRPNQDTSVHCALCNDPARLRMYPLTIKQLVVGWIYACPECEAKIQQHVLHFSFVEQDVRTS